MPPDGPAGASVLVWRRRGEAREWLVLRRSAAGAEQEGDWVWTPPGGAREGDEAVEECARRELLEETGLELRLEPTQLGDDSWVVFIAEAPVGAEVRLDAEHDKLEWLTAEAAVARCLPPRVGETFRRADHEKGRPSAAL